MTLTVQQAINTLGGRMAASKALAIPYTTIDYWYQENRLPIWRKNQVEAVLDGGRLKPSATISKRKARAA